MQEPVAEQPPQLPVGSSGYYACRQCRLVLSEPQWYAQGCSVCQTGPVPRGEIADAATTHFSHFVGLIAPGRSWVARLIGKGRKDIPNGVYAEALSDEDVDEELEEGDDYEEEEEEVADAASGAVEKRAGMTDEELLGLF